MHMSNRVFTACTGQRVAAILPMARIYEGVFPKFPLEGNELCGIQNCSDCAKLMGSEKEEFIELGELNS